MPIGGRQALRTTEGPSNTLVRRHKPDYLIILFMGLLMLIGLITIYATGGQRANVLNSAYGFNYSQNYFFIKQLVSIALSVFAFVALARIPYPWIVKHARAFLYIGLGACALLFISSVVHLPIAQATLGAYRWFNLGPLGSLQPAEILKFGIAAYVGTFVGMRVRQGKVNDLHQTLIPVGIITGLSLIFVVVIQKDLGTGIAIAAIVATIMMVGGINKKIGLMALLLLMGVGVIFILIAPHRIQRIVTYLGGNSSSSTSGSSYQIDNAKIAIGSGGLFGLGVGNSVQASGYLPEAINDSVFAIMGEIFGFVGLVAILLIFMGLLMRMLKIMDHLLDPRIKLIAAGIFGWFGAHVILNVAAIIGIFPLTGITLPLLSFGGTSMIFITAALGLMFQLSSYTVHSSKITEATSYEDTRSRRGVGRTRYASRGGSARA